MSTISAKITKRFLVNGTLTDVDTAVLRDATAAYGIKRHDTDEVIVAAGTAMDHDLDEPGVYTYTFTPAAGVTYDYAVEFTRGAKLYRAVDQLTVPVEANAPCYLTVTEADALAETMLSSLVAAYTAAETAQKQAALEQASADVDSAYRYQGRRYDVSGVLTSTPQVLEFPRLAYGDGCDYAAWAPGLAPAAGGRGNIWDWDDAAGTAVVPEAVKRAVVLQAADRLDGTRLAKVEQRFGLSAQATGSLSETYAAQPGSEQALMRVCPEARALLERYRLRSGGLL